MRGLYDNKCALSIRQLKTPSFQGYWREISKDIGEKTQGHSPGSLPGKGFGQDISCWLQALFGTWPQCQERQRKVSNLYSFQETSSQRVGRRNRESYKKIISTIQLPRHLNSFSIVLVIFKSLVFRTARTSPNSWDQVLINEPLKESKRQK